MHITWTPTRNSGRGSYLVGNPHVTLVITVILVTNASWGVTFGECHPAAQPRGESPSQAGTKHSAHAKVTDLGQLLTSLASSTNIKDHMLAYVREFYAARPHPKSFSCASLLSSTLSINVCLSLKNILTGLTVLCCETHF